MRSEVLAVQVEAAARAAGLAVVSSEAGEDYSGGGTARFKLAPAGEAATAAGKTMLLELSERFEFGRPDLKDGVRTYLAEAAKRLRNPRPECALTLHGIPLSFGRFEWPFHASSSGADTSLVHGEVRLESARLEDGGQSALHAKIAASMTVTFRDVVAAPEQPFAEGFVYNAVRKTMDQGQLELVKSGNRQPVPLTTRFYSPKYKTFSFNDTSEEGLLAIGRAGRWRAGVAAGPAGRAVSEYDGGGAAQSGGLAGGGGDIAGDGRGVRGRDGEADGAAGGVCCAVGADACVHPAIVQRGDAAWVDEYVSGEGVDVRLRN